VTKRDQDFQWRLGDLLTPAGLLTREAPVDVTLWPPVEDVKLSGGNLEWTIKEPARVVNGIGIHDRPIATPRMALSRLDQARAAKDMLRKFARLHSASDKEVLVYAKYWGPLSLCEHNLPYRHGALRGWAKSSLKMPPGSNLPEIEISNNKKSHPELAVHAPCSPLLRESLLAWRFFSRQVSAILAIAASVQVGNYGRFEDWQLVLEHGFPGGSGRARSLELNKVFLLEALNSWMTLGTVHLWASDLDGKVHLRGTDLFSKLGLQMALAASNRLGVYICSVCGQQYESARKLAAGRKRSCGKPECEREAARRRKVESRRGKQPVAPQPFPHLRCNFPGCKRPAYQLTDGGEQRRCDHHVNDPDWKKRKAVIAYFG
jgi:hypothetical protein